MSSSSSLSSSPASPRVSADTRGSDLQALNAMMEEGISPKVLLNHLAPSFPIPPDADDMMLWRLLVSMIEPPKRSKLTQFNTIEHAIDLIEKSKKVMVLSGAGISTSAGLPDFRSRNGIYVQIHAEHPDLHDPKCMFDIEYFKKNPLPFYQFAKALYPGQYKPTIGHKFIKCLEEHNKLLRNYSQNIDTLEKQAGIKNVIECHGSFANATCTRCKYGVDGDDIRADIFQQKVPLCPKCNEGNCSPNESAGLMKPNIVFFGEQLGEDFHNSLDIDKDQVDLLIVIGSSLKVRPVALIPRSIPPEVPQILINKEPLDHMNFDIELLGNCDEIIQELCIRLGDSWKGICEASFSRLHPIIGMPDSCRSFNTSLASKASPDQETKCLVQKEVNRDDKPSNSGCNKIEEKMASSAKDQAGKSSVRHNMIENGDKGIDEDHDNNEGAMTPHSIDSSDGDWEDVEILETSDSSDTSRRGADVYIPEGSFLYLKPNRYLFSGVELTKSQLDRFVQESTRDEINEQSQ